ncbi:MAG: MFS transporter [Chloroflexota bacterium]|nr:MFS transporter [Chloroflexota bacterium]
MSRFVLAELAKFPMLDSLRYPHFRLLWMATLLSTAGRWMEILVVGWLVLELTNSPFMVGAVAAVRAIGWLLGPLSGVVADRMDRRLFLLLTQSVNLTLTATMFLLLSMGRLEVWHIFALSLFGGITYALDYPPRNTFILDLVGKGAVLNAIALSRVAMDITAILGPAIGGSLVAFFGIKVAYGFMVAVYLMDVLVLVMLPSVARTSPARRGSVWADLIEGLEHIRSHQTILWLLVMGALVNFLGFPYMHTLMPIFARDVLAVGPTGLGLLMASVGVGALVGTLGVASLGSFRRKGWLTVISIVLWPAMLALFSLSPWYPLSLFLLFWAGVSQAIAMTTSTTLLLTNVPDEMQARVMGARALVIVTLPFGALIMGAGAGLLEAPLTLALSEIALAAMLLAIAIGIPALRRLE